MELTAETDGTDGTFYILPPEAIEGETPSHYSFTVGGKYTNSEGSQEFSLTTDGGLEPWAVLQVDPPSQLTGDETTTSELAVTLENFDRDPRRTYFFMENYPYGTQQYYLGHGSPLDVTLDLPDNANELFITHHPDWETESNLAPAYLHKENPGDLGSSGVTYDVSQADGNRFRYQTDILNGFPDEFKTVETDLQVQNWSLDNLEMDASDEADYKYVYTVSSSGTWRVFMSAETESFAYPRIADSLDQSVTSYNRSGFEVSTLSFTDRLDYDGYSDYLDDYYGGADFGYNGNWTQKIISNSSSSKAKSYVPRMQQSKEIQNPGEGNYRKLPQTFYPGR